MTSRRETIKELNRKLDILLVRQEDFAREIARLRTQIEKISATENDQEVTFSEDLSNRVLPDTDFVGKIPEPTDDSVETTEVRADAKKTAVVKVEPSSTEKPSSRKSDLERFIGENLISKVGIGITIIGVAIGAKYSIDHNLVSPLARIIMGYLTAVGLLGIGIKLRKKYEQYSAVLVSGAMAIMYFITYFAHSFYGLIPQLPAFVLMMLFTVFTVFSAVKYNRQIIAQIGLVGAYAVPFLLSDGSGKVLILFSYMTIINIGILATAFYQYWKSLYISAFSFTWIIFLGWLITEYRTNEHFALAFTFLAVFFVTFHLTFLASKKRNIQQVEKADIVLILLNSFVFFALGYSILTDHQVGKDLLGAFSVGNAIIHFALAMVIKKWSSDDHTLHHLILGLALVFATVAVPVQFDGNWVTMIWAMEAALLFWIGRTKSTAVFEQLSYPMMVLAFASIAQDWLLEYSSYFPLSPESRITPIFNIHFLTSVLFVMAFAFINYLNRLERFSTAVVPQGFLFRVFKILIPGILLMAVYFSFLVEIINYWQQLYLDSAIGIVAEDAKIFPGKYRDADLLTFKHIWLINYSLLFVSALAFSNLRKIRNPQLGRISMVLIFAAMILFLTHGLYSLSDLRESYLDQTMAQYHDRGIFHILIRYVSLLFVALTLFAAIVVRREQMAKAGFKAIFELGVHLSIVWILSSELIHWMDMADSSQSYKLGLSILWGVYSLFLIVLGIWKKRKYLRMGAIVLFAVTLIKLFFYDIAHLNTISKTIVFVSLGVLLLIISYLYNRFKDTISDG